MIIKIKEKDPKKVKDERDKLDAYNSAVSKLMGLGLSQAEIEALFGRVD